MSTWCHYYKKSRAYINSLYLTSLFVILSVFAYLLSWNRWNLSISIFGGFSAGWPQCKSFIFRTCIKGHQLYWKVSVSFSHRSSQRGIRYLSEAEPDNVFPPASVPPPCHDPLRSSHLLPRPKNSTDTCDDESFRSLALDPFSKRSPVMIECPLQLEMSQIKG